MPVVDLIIPLFNEEDTILSFHRMLLSVEPPRGFDFRFIYVNDGSQDRTQELLDGLAASDSRMSVIRLSRNFGHQAALSAGLDAAAGDVVITLDGDGQHPPSLIPQMLGLFSAGYDLVQTQRLDDINSGGLLKRSTSRLFYRLLSSVADIDLQEGVSDFRLLSRNALNALRQLPEYHRFLRGMTVWIGFSTVVLPFKPEKRLAGSPKYSFNKMLRLATDGLFSFSLVPLRIALILGLGFILLSGVELAYIAFVLLSGHREHLVPGWTSLILILTVSGALNMILQGVLGTYIGMIFHEVKRRPVYLVRSRTN